MWKGGVNKFDYEKPYCSQAIIDILHEAFFGSTRVHRFHLASYRSSISHGPASEEHELPSSMVALVATTVGAYYFFVPGVRPDDASRLTLA